MTQFDWSVVVQVLFVMSIVKGLVDGLVTPLFEHQKWDKFYILYVSWVLGVIIILLTPLNLFAGLITNPLAGRIFTGLIAAFVANIVHDSTDNPATE